MLKEIAKVTPTNNADLTAMIKLLEDNGYFVVNKKGSYMVCEGDTDTKPTKKTLLG